jgi:REP element-mobilizing transposase RayT
MRKYYLVTTEHLEESLWFRDEEDFATGMNHVAIQAALSPAVTVLVFILMSNHVHFVLYGSREDVERFVNGFKGRYSQYLKRKYGTKEFLRRNGLDIKVIAEDEAESLERAMAYVQMNCVAANICLYPGQYPWGTGNAFFQAAGGGKTGHRSLGELSGRERIRLLHSGNAIALPDEWMLSDAGYVLPESYIDVELVETTFRSPRRMQFFLNSSSKARKRLDEENLPAFRDQLILSALPELLQSLFQKPSFGALSVSEQAETLRQIRFRFSAGVHQAARVCGLTYDQAARLLDTA